MQPIITDEEVTKLWNIYNESCNSSKEATKEALTDFLNNRPQVAQLRPIAEMPETVPEGYVRFYGDKQFLAYAQGGEDTLAVDIQLPTPDPEAEERRQFEEAMKKEYPAAGYNYRDGKYEIPATQTAWIAWKLAKKGGDK